MIIRFHIFEKELIEKKVQLTEQNHFEVKFLLEKEMRNVKDRLNSLKQKGVIKTTSRNARILDRSFKDEVVGLMYSRQTLVNCLCGIK